MEEAKAPSALMPDSDLAGERIDTRRATFGYSFREKAWDDLRITALSLGEEEATLFGKPAGKYLSVSYPPYLPSSKETQAHLQDVIAASILFFLSPLPSRVLVAGLGNRRLTADAFGPLAAESVTASAALPESAKALGILPPVRVSVCVPDVFARTGIESVQSVGAAARLANAEGIVAIDALASATKENLLSVFEITDTGTVPGGGVKRGKASLSRASLGIPVIAIGLPTVIRADAEHFIVPRDLETGVAELALLTADAIDLAFTGHTPTLPFSLEELFKKEKP